MESASHEIINGLEHKDKKISDEETFRTLTAVGNHEGKGITLLALSDGLSYDTGPLYSKVMGLQGSTPGWKIDFKGPREYCSYSFEPAGLVEHANPAKPYEYQITDEGMRSVPLVGHLLSLSLKYTKDENGEQIFDEQGEPMDISLIHLLGAGAQARGRNPELKRKIVQNRLDILRKLKESSMPLAVNEFGADAHLIYSGIIEELSASGIIKYKGFHNSVPDAIAYTMGPRKANDEVPQFKKLKSLSDAVLNVLPQFTEGSVVSPTSVVAKLQESGFTNNMRPDVLRTVVRQMLLHFSKNGVLVPEFENGNRSSVWLTDVQRTLATELLDIIEKYQAQEPQFLADGIIKADSLLKDSQKIARLMAKAKRKSSYGNKLDPQVESGIVNILTEYKNLTPAQIEGELEVRLARAISGSLIEDALKRMEGTGKIEKQIDGTWKTKNIDPSTN